MIEEVQPRQPPAKGTATRLGGGKAVGRPEKKIDFGSQWRPTHHRSGWPYALDALASLHISSGTLLDGFIEKKFGWGEDPGDLRNDPRPYIRPWIGFWHNPPFVPAALNLVGHAPQEILASWLWRESSPYCRGLFTLSAYLARWLRDRVPVPVCSVFHPTEPPTVTFSVQRFLANPHKKVVQVGWWLRNYQSFFDLQVPSMGKVLLASPPLDERQAEVSILRMPYLGARDYDELLSENIVFLDLYDSSANNAIIECIARSTPIVINPLPAVIEYLGAEYPLYYNDLEEAAAKAQDARLALAAHQYLRDHAIQQRVTRSAFLRSFVDSSVYRNLGPASDQVSGRDSTTQRPEPLGLITPADISPQPTVPWPPQPASSVPGSGLTPPPRSQRRPAVTIFTSVYAADDDLQQFLQNVCGQTIFSRCELLLFDVCYSHRCPDLVRRQIAAYQAVHPNISYHRLAADPGLYQIWNRAIRSSSSPYLTNANLDDRKAPDSLAEHLNALVCHPEVDVVCSEMLVTTEANETWEDNSACCVYFKTFNNGAAGLSSLNSRTEFGIADLFLYDKSGRPFESQNIPHCMPMWRRSLHLRYGMFDPLEFGAVADWEFWARCASLGARFMVLHKLLGMYTVRPSSHNHRAFKSAAKNRIIKMYAPDKRTSSYGMPPPIRRES
jgi:hypothetical protein